MRAIPALLTNLKNDSPSEDFHDSSRFQIVCRAECTLELTEAQMREQLSDRNEAFEEYMLMKAQPICIGSASALSSGTCTVIQGMVVCAYDVAGVVERI